MFVNIFGEKINKKQRGYIMSTCNSMRCAYFDGKSGKCNFHGHCIIKDYNLGKDTILKIVPAEAKLGVVAETAPVIDENVVFNPFQRGNGCMLAGVAREEILKHTR